MRSSNFISLLTVVLSSYFFYTSGYAQIGFDIPSGKNKVSFPFESYNNLIVVPVILNHQIPLRFVLDTGVRTAILTDRTFSDILNISYDRMIPLVGADGDRQVIAYVASGISLKLPGVVGQGQALLVLEEDYLQLKNYLGTDVHGILGYEIFNRFIVEIDYASNLLTLHEPFSYKARKRHTFISLEVQDTKPYIQTNIKLLDSTTVPVKLMVDTGASHSLLLDMDSHIDLKLPERVVRSNLGRGLGGDINGHIARIESLDFGKYTFDDIIVSWPDRGSFVGILRKTGRQGTLGAGLLNRFTIVIDYYNGKLYYRKNRNFNNEFEFNMSGIDVIATGENLNQFIISGIRKNSPATKADIQVGDKLTMINSHLTSDLTLGEVTSFFRLKPGRRLRLELIREDEKLVRKIRLERAI